MLRSIAIAVFVVPALAFPASGAVREIAPSELRTLVSQGAGYGLKDILRLVAANFEGEAVDARAFDSDGLIYTILIKLPNGKYTSVMIDALSAQIVSERSARGQAVASFAKSSSGQNNAGNGNAFGKSKDKSNNGKGNGKGKAKGKNK